MEIEEINEVEDIENLDISDMTNSEKKEFKIKETSITLNTLDSGSVTGVTDVINGVLECIIISSDKPVQILIFLNEYPEIVLYQLTSDSIVGTKYLSLRTNAITERNEKFTFTDSKWILNDQVVCQVLGQKNATIKVILRYC